ncbi:MAG: formimidoylglutamase [Chlamydiales bacterium]|nr:formimidoylglutamase [Chlamydiia bacterium]MCP5507687.1 formimidoylglutamase [Chlamydiales bacterium]
MNICNDLYVPASHSIWCGRDDGAGHPRFHHAIKCVDLNKELPESGSKSQVAILGFASDEGVKRNQGREGAINGPEALRGALAGLPFHRDASMTLIDAGDIRCKSGDLESAQKALGDAVGFLLNKGFLPIICGGGHETAWGSYQGIASYRNFEDLEIVNVDAHFDLRDEGSVSTSGTPFLQIARDRQIKGLPFSYTCLGIQETGNTRGLFDRASELHVTYIKAEELHELGSSAASPVIDQLQSKHVYLSICLDAFNASVAPGVSAPQVMGIMPWYVTPAIIKLAASGNVCCFDVVELCPKYDVDNITAKLAASLVSTFIHHLP